MTRYIVVFLAESDAIRFIADFLIPVRVILAEK